MSDVRDETIEQTEVKIEPASSERSFGNLCL